MYLSFSSMLIVPHRMYYFQYRIYFYVYNTLNAKYIPHTRNIKAVIKCRKGRTGFHFCPR